MVMSAQRRMQFVCLQTAWMLAVVVVLVALDAMLLDLFVVLTVVGFLVVIEFTTVLSARPDWRRRVRWLGAVLVLVSVVLIARRVAAILPQGVL